MDRLHDLAVAHATLGIHPAINLLIATYKNIENIKLYKQQCLDMSGRCVGLMLAFRDSSEGLEGTRTIELADEIAAIVQRIDRKLNDWAGLSRLKSFLQQQEIKDGIDRLHRDIDATMMEFNIQINMELRRGQRESRAIQERDNAEIREVLQKIIKSTDDMKALLSMHDSQPVDEIMESLQTELRNPSLQLSQEQSFKQGLWLLHEKTSKLPPLTDLTGQVKLVRKQVVAKGTSNDIYMGEWLDQERVALRLPRTLVDDPNAQKSLQREVTIWRTLNHPNVVPLYGIVYIDENMYSVSPWMDNGTAISYVQHPAVDRLRILSEVASGLEYLHTKGIVHGDLRGANILISKNGAARLSDFGLSKFLEECGQGMTSSPGINPRWLAPELFRPAGALSTHSDVWSFAMVCLELMTGEQPFSVIRRDIAVMYEVDRGHLPDRPGRHITARGLTDDLWSLMKTCWNKKPGSRPSMTYVKAKLSGIHGLPSSTKPISMPIKRHSMFSRRSSTARSDAGVKSSNPRHRLSIPSMSSAEDQIAEESGQSLSHISVTAGVGLQHWSPSSVFENEASDGDFQQGGSTTKSKSSGPFELRPPRAEALNLSASLPASSGTHFLRQSTPVDVSPSPTRSILSQSNALLKDAITNPEIIINFSRSGSVSSGTLEGLVERLVNNFSLQKDLEYRDILLTGCGDFTTPDDLFKLLARRFHEAETRVVAHPEDRIAIQYNIFMIIMYWLSSRNLQVNPQLLGQMKKFCETALTLKTSITMSDKAKDLMNLIDERITTYARPPLLPLSPGRRIPKFSEILPRDLAIALTLLEGDKYRSALPTDYIAHLRRNPGLNSVEDMCVTNNKIVLWVKQSVLHYDELELRTQVLKFFINTAQECRKLRNFASLTAIANALHSAPIDRLRLTKKELPPSLRHILDDLDDILDPSSNHKTYRAALNEFQDTGEQGVCVPWVAVHLHELHASLHKYPAVVELDGRPLINFEWYIRFMDRIKEIFHYTPPDLEWHRRRGPLAYLECQLDVVQLRENVDDELMERSVVLEAGEARDHRTRRQELRRLGFRAL